MEYNQPSEIVKDVNFGENANKKVVAGVEKLAKAVKSTLGASGKCVIYEDARGFTGDYKKRCNSSRICCLYLIRLRTWVQPLLKKLLKIQ